MSSSMKKLKNDFFIYFIINKINGKIYVGKTNRPQNRWQEHLRTASDKSNNGFSVIHSAILKYGKDSFEFIISEHYSSSAEVNQAEKYWISFLRESGIVLYNQTDGGDGLAGLKFTDEHRQRISNSSKGKIFGPVARMKMSAAKKFIFAGSKNVKAKLTDEQIIRIRELYRSGKYSHRELGKIFGVKHSTIGKIIRRELWPHIE